MSHTFAVPCLMLILGCQPQNKTDYANTYLIPDGYHGWLVIREKPGGKPRPQVVTYQFDSQGFCVSDVKLGTDFFSTHYFYVNASGRRLEIPSGDYTKTLDAEKVYAHSVESTATATSDQYQGEIWHLLYVGTPGEFEVARTHDGDFLSRFQLYKTVTVTKN